MRRRRSVPLLALRAFEASAQLLSFTLAADMLGVTQSAVSRHVKHLEDFVGMKLFERRTRALELTAGGEALLPRLTRAFDLIDDTLRDLRANAAPLPVTIGMPPTFAIRLGWNAVVRFQGARPDAEVRVRVNTEMPNGRGDIDIAIEFLHETEARRSHRLLFAERLVPVCSPDVAHRLAARPFEAAIAGAPLLHVAQRTDTHVDWRIWLEGAELEGAGLETVRYARGLIFDTADMTMQAALKGAGIAVADLMYVTPYVEAGLLVLPHPYVHISGRGYYMSIRDNPPPPDTAQALWQWLLDGNWKEA